ncbi:hypothetical protein ZIOFF_017180 [Zingiber officinale]|uniref:GTP cyclohydrolase 1 n=1 Tax=Zingiber officinale TaxID=94328 RepID=A0A8J5HRI7_ZINOF|nr:hypothetical protein ZIOFF_017180 [Zingiber officinale]
MLASRESSRRSKRRRENDFVPKREIRKLGLQRHWQQEESRNKAWLPMLGQRRGGTWVTRWRSAMGFLWPEIGVRLDKVAEQGGARHLCALSWGKTKWRRSRHLITEETRKAEPNTGSGGSGEGSSRRGRRRWGEEEEEATDLLASEAEHALSIEEAVKALLQGLGEDHEREGLRRTPHRVAEAFRGGTIGYKQKAKDIMQGALFPEAGLNPGVGHAGGVGGLVVVRDINLFSYCESCLLPFSIKCHVGYVPSGGRVVGLNMQSWGTFLASSRSGVFKEGKNSLIISASVGRQKISELNQRQVVRKEERLLISAEMAIDNPSATIQVTRPSQSSFSSSSENMTPLHVSAANVNGDGYDNKKQLEQSSEGEKKESVGAPSENRILKKKKSKKEKSSKE